MSDLPPPPPPPPYPSGSYGQPVPQYSPSGAIGVGFRTFREHWQPFIGIALITIVVTAIIRSLGGTSGNWYQQDNTVRSFVFGLVAQAVGLILAAAQIKGALDAVDGKEVTLGSMFEGWDKVKVIIAAVIVSVLTVIGFVLLIIPGIIVAFLTYYTQFYVVDRDLSPVEALRASVAFTSAHLGPLVVLTLLAIGVLILGAVCLLVGLLVAFPTVLIAAAYTFRQLPQPATA